MRPKKIDHIGIAVSSLEEVIGVYRDLFGLEATHIEEVPEQKVRVAFVPVGDSKLELLESTDPEGPIARFLASRGEGVQHVAFRVDDIEQAIADAKARGYRMIDEVPRRGAGGARIAFMHPKGTRGVLIELCQRDEPAKEPDS